MAHHGAGLRRITGDDRLAERLGRDPDLAPLPARERAMVDWALKLTRRPAEMTREDLEPLRTAGLDDRALLDLAMIVGYYAYVNRIADGLGVELEAHPPGAGESSGLESK
ncbi:MAG: peroxidase [bacterium]|nr:peroxidase [bacterium]